MFVILPYQPLKLPRRLPCLGLSLPSLCLQWLLLIFWPADPARNMLFLMDR